MSRNYLFDSESIDEEGKLQLVIGRIGTGKTSFGISLAEQEKEIISNLESVEGAFYANSPEAVKTILRFKPETRFAVLLDDITSYLSWDSVGQVKAREIVDLVSELVDLGHRVILTGTVLDDFPDELLYYREGEWDGAAEDVYHLTELGTAEYREIHRIGGQLETETVCSFPAAHPSRAFDSQDIPEFEFDADCIKFAYPGDEDDSEEDLTEVSGVDEGVALLLEMFGYETIDDLRRATENDIAGALDSYALAVRIKADVGNIEPEEEDEEPSFAEFFGLTQEEADAFRDSAEKAFEDDSEELVVCSEGDCGATSDQHKELLRDDVECCPYHREPDDAGLPDDLFDPDDWPPQFHLDNLESQLDYNLGQVDGFLDLDRQAKCDLARLTVDNDLSIEECETILELSQDVVVRDSDA